MSLTRMGVDRDASFCFFSLAQSSISCTIKEDRNNLKSYAVDAFGLLTFHKDKNYIDF